MVAKAGRYFFHPFQGYRGVIQGDTLSPTILNMVVEAVIWHWATVMVAQTEAGAEGLRETIQELAEFFYVDDGLVASPWTERLQRAFNVLTNLFDWVGLCTNVWKKVSMD